MSTETQPTVTTIRVENLQERIDVAGAQLQQLNEAHSAQSEAVSREQRELAEIKYELSRASREFEFLTRLRDMAEGVDTQ